MARVTLHYPPANVLTHAVLQELEQVFAELEADEYVRVVVLTGSDRFFSAGADIHELKHLQSKYGGAEFSTRGQACLNRIERFDKPVIAAINGICLGGGLELAMACHVQIAAAGSSLGLPEIALGVIPGFGGTQRMTRLVGLSKATELILTGERVAAEEALSMGLVSRVVPADSLLKEAETLAGVIAARGRAATRAALRAIRGGCDRPVSEGLIRESELFGELCETPDKNEGIQAFLEKRPPHFADTDT
ncbi:MAG: enoyl-CoA hydratase-related protein [Nitrospirota bacterium]|nr:enoyl-CoA hydratase-related protein [Nitrospirota bacterium]